MFKIEAFTAFRSKNCLFLAYIWSGEGGKLYRHWKGYRISGAKMYHVYKQWDEEAWRANTQVATWSYWPKRFIFCKLNLSATWWNKLLMRQHFLCPQNEIDPFISCFPRAKGSCQQHLICPIKHELQVYFCTSNETQGVLCFIQ